VPISAAVRGELPVLGNHDPGVVEKHHVECLPHAQGVHCATWLQQQTLVGLQRCGADEPSHTAPESISYSYSLGDSGVVRKPANLHFSHMKLPSVSNI
jgi:hypothetical protein